MKTKPTKSMIKSYVLRVLIITGASLVFDALFFLLILSAVPGSPMQHPLKFNPYLLICLSFITQIILYFVLKHGTDDPLFGVLTIASRMFVTVILCSEAVGHYWPLPPVCSYPFEIMYSFSDVSAIGAVFLAVILDLLIASFRYRRKGKAG